MILQYFRILQYHCSILYLAIICCMCHKLLHYVKTICRTLGTIAFWACMPNLQKTGLKGCFRHILLAICETALKFTKTQIFLTVFLDIQQNEETHFN